MNIGVIVLRYLVSLAFIPSGLKKVLGERFTQMSTETPIGYFFEAMYQAGPYWNFLGLLQMLAAFLLMTQVFATLGAILFLVIVGNIWVINIALQFSGTVLVSSLLLLAVIGLLAWDWNKIRFLFAQDNYFERARPTYYPTHNACWIAEGIFIFFYSIGLVLFLEHHPAIPAGARLCAVAIIPVSILLIFLINRKQMFGASLSGQ
ncbi:MAG: DoxX family protein [Chitinophagaceae bacterium]|nr:MAG: DoxX family protein [Chitinophagaceae bacterium]